MAKTKNLGKKRKYLLELLNKAHCRMDRNKAFHKKRGTDFIPIRAVENMVSVRRALMALLKEAHRAEIDQWHDSLREAQALAQERLIGPHACPDWDFMELGPGSVEFCCCSCRPFEGPVPDADHQAFLLYHHKTKIIPPEHTVRDQLEWYYLAGLRRGRGEK